MLPNLSRAAGARFEKAQGPLPSIFKRLFFGYESLSVRLSDGDPVAGSHLLVATGRRPNTDDLGLDKAGVGTDQQGFIKVNGRLETSVPGVYPTLSS